MQSYLLVTGASGFLGSAVVDQAVSSGVLVKATDRNINTKFIGDNFIPADILDPLSLSKVFEGVDCVCHVAGLAHIFHNPEALTANFHTINVVGSENVARAAFNAGAQHLIFISSVSVYGGISKNKGEDEECYPEGPYAESKWKAEQFLIEFCQKNKMNLSILRLATLYGEEDPGNVKRLISAIDKGRFIWVGKGNNLKSLLHRKDAARACIEVVKNPISGISIYNVSTQACTMKDIVETIASALPKKIPSWRIPSSFALHTVKIMKNLSFNHDKLNSLYSTLQKWMADDCYNTDKFCKTYDFQTIVTLEEGIKREVAWYMGNLKTKVS